MSDKQPNRQRRPYKSSKYAGDGDGEQPHPSQLKRRRQAAVSLSSFSSKKGHDRALQEFKKRKDTKFQKNAVLLRGYQKAMKKGGYDVGRGASRKRDRLDGDEDVIEGDETEMNRGKKESIGNDEEEELQTTTEEPSYKKRHKSDPLHHARKKAELRKAEQLELTSQKEQRQQTEGQKVQSRKTKARKLMKRTRRGQPVMKNVIGDLLGKIRSEVGDEGETG
mmetsp:Transcript_6117/g.9629  ORF Transcript_6117/g.9629 Transcript_6117/m.9629 type:complete len:222 (+) Transcript_6117:97-762(+)